MLLRRYTREDADVICGWIRDEADLRRWSADRFGAFPVSGADLDDNYAAVTKNGGVIPLTAMDEAGRVIGHLFIRYPDEKDRRTVRFGFVILDPALRGRGMGREMLEAAVGYARENLKAARITLGVFADNKSALSCYGSVGFHPTGERVTYRLSVGEWECIEMAMDI